LTKDTKLVILSIFLFALSAGILFLGRPPRSQIPSHHSTSYNLTPTTSILLAGDIMLSRNVAAAMYKANDFTLPFQNVKDLISGADIAFANLESPFNDQGDHSVEGSMVFNADPKFAAGLQDAGFDILSTANNHALDQGTTGLDLTINLLKQNNIIPTGTVSTTGEPILPVIKKNNILYGFLSYSYTAKNDGGQSTSPYINDFNNLTKLRQDIVSLKGHNADVVIVNMHAGVEYTRTPTPEQVAFAHAAIDAGAELVVGEHPHWVQTIEQYKGKWIFYSLGNFVFDQMFSPDTSEGLAVNVVFKDNTVDSIELLPVEIENFCCPRWAMSIEAAAILKKINPQALSNFVVKDGVVSADWVNQIKSSDLTNP